MKDFSVHIKSTDAANIFINGTFVGLLDNYENFSLDLQVYCESLVVTKQPISKQKKFFLPYTVKLSFENNVPVCDSDFIKIVPYKFNEYDVVLLPCDVKSHKPLNKIYDDFVENLNLVVVNDGQSYVNLYLVNVLKFSTTIQEINAITCEKQNNYIVIKGATLAGNYYLLVIDENGFMPIFNSEVHKIETNGTQIKTLKKINDIAKHAQVNVLDLQNGTNNQEYYVYLNDEAVICESPKLIPYAFLQALKVKNYELAKQYLSQNLNNKTTDEHLNQYFTNLQEIYYNNYNTNENLVNYTIFANNYKSYDFSIVNNKIDDIEQVNINYQAQT